MVHSSKLLIASPSHWERDYMLNYEQAPPKSTHQKQRNQDNYKELERVKSFHTQES